VPDVLRQMTDGVGDAVEQAPDLVDRQRNQLGFGPVGGPPFFSSWWIRTKNAAAAMDKVMCRYQAV
jgi:hypothetical protein